MHNPDGPSMAIIFIMTILMVVTIGLLLWIVWMAVIAVPDPCTPVKTCAHPMPILVDGTKHEHCINWQDAGVLNPQECKN